jgi:hypothetical protein
MKNSWEMEPHQQKLGEVAPSCRVRELRPEEEEVAEGIICNQE